MAYGAGAGVKDNWGAIAQLGERYNGIVEVSGSIPLSSTKLAQNIQYKLVPKGTFLVCPVF